MVKDRNKTHNYCYLWNVWKKLISVQIQVGVILLVHLIGTKTVM